MVGTFSLIHFYHLIVKTLLDNTLPWVAETMEWWQRHVSTPSSPHMPNINVHHRKMFGDESRGSTRPSKHFRITANTSYKCTTQCIQQKGSGREPQEVVVYRGVLSDVGEC